MQAVKFKPFPADICSQCGSSQISAIKKFTQIKVVCFNDPFVCRVSVPADLHINIGHQPADPGLKFSKGNKIIGKSGEPAFKINVPEFRNNGRQDRFFGACGLSNDKFKVLLVCRYLLKVQVKQGVLNIRKPFEREVTFQVGCLSALYGQAFCFHIIYIAGHITAYLKVNG